jgi:hypothetical protein
MILNSQMRNLATLKWAHVTTLAFVGVLLLILPMAGSHRVSLENLQTVWMMSFGIILLLTAGNSLLQLRKSVDRINVIYTVLLIVSIAILGYCAYYVYDFNRSRGNIPTIISVFIWGGIVLSLIIIFRKVPK